MQYEVDILECLRNFPVIKLQRVGGEYIFSVEGKAAILYLYIDGDFKENNTLKELNIGGEFLGEFHNECTDIKCPRDHFEFYNLSDRMIQEYSTYIADVDIPHKELLPKIVWELTDNTLSHEQPSGPIHVDFGPKNTLWKNGKLVAVLDFDNAYNGPYILDIWKSIMFFASFQWKFQIQKAKAFFNGYISKRILWVQERKEIYKAIKFAFLSHVFVDYYMYAKKVTTDEYFDYIVNDLFVSYKSFLIQLNSCPDFLYEDKY